MGKVWMGYVSSVLMFFAGLLMFLAAKPVIGALFILLSVAGLVIRYYMNKGNGNKPEHK